MLEDIGDYKIIQPLGEGGFSVVHLAEQKDTGSKFAIKIAEPSMQDSGSRKRAKFIMHSTKVLSIFKIDLDGINYILEKEYEALKSIQHPSFVKVYDKGVHKGRVYLVLEYIKGRTLRKHLQDVPKLDVSLYLNYMKKILDILLAIEKEGLICHGDIKPDNIILSNYDKVRIIDPSYPSWKEDQLITSPSYNPFLSSNDITSIGIMLYEITTGFLPFNQCIKYLVEPQDQPKEENALLSDFVSPADLNPDFFSSIDFIEGLEEIILKSLGIEKYKNKYIMRTRPYSLSYLRDILGAYIKELKQYDERLV